MNKKDNLESTVFSAFYGDFSSLRDMQEATVAPISSGKNLILTAGTGSGKTEAILVPFINKYWREALLRDELFLLYIAPTKALLNDLEKRLHLPLRKIGLRLGIRHGDRDDLIKKDQPHVLLTTPESLDVLLVRKEKSLKTLKAVIIDEIHLLYNTQRGLQLSILLRRLRDLIKNKFQWAAISATISNLSDIRSFIFGSEEDATLLSYPPDRFIEAHVRHLVDMRDFIELMAKLLTKNIKLLVFANSRFECEKIACALEQNDLLKNFVFTHYSSMSHELRVKTEQYFSSQKKAICVSTSTLELGIDIGDIDAVILWDMPTNVESFLQKIGRGNRRLNKCNVICIIPYYDSYPIIKAIQFLALIDIASSGKLPMKRPYELYGAIIQQIMSIIASEKGNFIKVSDLLKVFSHKSYLSKDIIDSICSELSCRGFLKKHGYLNRYGAAENLYRLLDLKLIYGNFSEKSQTINVFHEKNFLGEVPINNLLYLKNGDFVRFSGKYWQIDKITKNKIYLRPSKPTNKASDFFYGGNFLTIDPYIIDSSWRLIHSQNIKIEILNKNIRERVSEFIQAITKNASEYDIPFIKTNEGILYYTFAGSLVNKAVALLSKKSGFEEFELTDITLRVSYPIDWSSIPQKPSDFEKIFPSLFGTCYEQSIYQKLLPTNLQKIELSQQWLKDDTIVNILERLKNSKCITLNEFKLSL